MFIYYKLTFLNITNKLKNIIIYLLLAYNTLYFILFKVIAYNIWKINNISVCPNKNEFLNL